MYRDLIRPPLQQTLIVLWLIALILLGSWTEITEPTWTWVFSALFGSILSILVAGRFRRMWILTVAVVSGLGGVLGVAHIIVLPTSTLWTLVALYALLLWITAQMILKHPLTNRFITLLKLQGGWGEKGGRQLAEATIHWSCFALVLASLLLPIMQAHTLEGIPLGSLTNLPIGLLFLWLSGHHFRLQLHAHLFIFFGAWMALTLYAWLVPPIGLSETSIALQNPALGMILGLYALGIMAVDRWVSHNKHNQDDSMANLFSGPLAGWAVTLATLTALQALSLGQPGWSGPISCGLAGLTLLLASRSLAGPMLTLSGAGLSVLTLCWIYSTVRYSSPPFGLWPGRDVTFDQWLLLGILTLALASLCRFLVRYPQLKLVYQQPLFVLAWLMFICTLLGAMILLPSMAADSIQQALVSLALISLVLITTLFPLLGPLQYWRGVATALLTSMLLASLLGTNSLQQWGTMAAIGWAYALWVMGIIVLPRINKHLHSWAIDGEIWPWVGLVMVCMGIYLAWPALLFDWQTTLLITGYLFLLTHSSRLSYFPWIAVPILAWACMLWSKFGSTTVDQWLQLGILTLALASLCRFLARYTQLQRLYQRPLFALAWFMFGWTVLGALVLVPATSTGSIHLALVWLALSAVLFPLFGSLQLWRGVAAALLFTLLLTSLLGTDILLQWGAMAAISWAYILWVTGNIVLPRINKHLHSWGVAGESWPWFGLAMLGIGIYLAWPALFTQWNMTLAITVYLFLLSRNSRHSLFPWSAVLLFSWAGISWSMSRSIEIGAPIDRIVSASMAIENLLWANILLLIIPFWQRYGKAITTSLVLHHHSLQIPLVVTATAVCGFWTFWLGFWELGFSISESGSLANKAFSVPLAIVLSLTYLHLLWQYRKQSAAHLLLFSVALTMLVVWSRNQLFSLCLLFTLWGVVVMTLNQALTPYSHWLSRLLHDASKWWLPQSIAVATAALFLVPDASLEERLSSLAILAAASTYIGWRQLNRRWLVIAVVMTLGLAHGLWLLWIPATNFLYLILWYALQSALFTWLLIWVVGRAQPPGNTVDSQQQPAMAVVITVLKQVTPWVGSLAVIEWSIPGSVLFTDLTSGHEPQPFTGFEGTIVYLAATLVLAGLSIHKARRTQLERWVYCAAALIGTAGFYLRLLWVGLAPLNPWDTAAIMASAYGLFLLERITLSRPVFHLTMALPLLAMMTVPYQMGSVDSTLTLLAAGSLYLLTRRTTGTETPLYLSLLSINAATYLWVPDWSERFGLFQVYLVPVALSILLLLHLHRDELKKSVLHASRLTTLTLLYAAATMDVFLVDNLSVFALALAVSFGSILMGIGLRIRAFLYSGVVFLVINVIGQLILLYPEQRLGKALMLIGLGTVVTGSMIWLSIKRELILERIRVFRADLIHWE